MRSHNNSIERIKRLLFSNILDGLVSLIIILLIIFSTIFAFKWIFFLADWSVVKLNLPLYLFGSFPIEQRWRPSLWLLILLSLTLITLIGPRWRWIRKSLPIAWIIITPIGIYLLSGGLMLSEVSNRFWGCLLYTSPSPRDVEESRMPSSA